MRRTTSRKDMTTLPTRFHRCCTGRWASRHSNASRHVHALIVSPDSKTVSGLKVLTREGADVDSTTLCSFTPLHDSVLIDSKEIAQVRPWNIALPMTLPVAARTARDNCDLVTGVRPSSLSDTRRIAHVDCLSRCYLFPIRVFASLTQLLVDVFRFSSRPARTWMRRTTWTGRLCIRQPITGTAT